MPGFSNDTVYGTNVNFTGSGGIAGREPTVTSDGQLLIGSTATPNIKVGKITSTGGTIDVTSGSGTINLEAVSGASGITTINVQVFTSSGTYTPTAQMDYCFAECIGGGGGAGGCAAGGGNFAATGGGGGGGYCKGLFTASTIGASQTVTIGIGGSGGAAGNNNGNDGSLSSLGTLLIANKGFGSDGGSSVAVDTIGVGGSGANAGSGGEIAIGGNHGFNSLIIPTSAASQVVGGSGGNTLYGIGGSLNIPSAASAQNGAAGTGYGSGGGGAASRQSASAAAGGAAKSGVIIITEYISS